MSFVDGELSSLSSSKVFSETGLNDRVVMDDTGAVSRRRMKKTIFLGVVLLIVALASMVYRGFGPDPARRLQANLLAMRNNGHLDGQGTANIGIQAVRDMTDYEQVAEICDTCCYRYTTIGEGITDVLSDSELEKKGCRQRLPDAMIFGVKKGGTTTLKNFVSYHPDIAFAQDELKFFTSRSERNKGLEYYRRQMPYSTPGQISMEKTPAYIYYTKVPGLIKDALPNIKLILIMRDPVERAVSDYVHMQVTIAKTCLKAEPACNYTGGGYFIADTFDESVVVDGEVMSSNPLISKGVYVKHVQRYLEYFEPEQILAIDGEAFISEPYPAVKKVEQFLGIRDYFTRDHFYYDVQKGFFCLNKPIPNNCMNKSKGRRHPQVQEETLKKLRDYYRPYNKALSQLLQINFQWSS